MIAPATGFWLCTGGLYPEGGGAAAGLTGVGLIR